MYVLNVSPRLQDGKWDICILAPAGFDKASCHVEEDSTEGTDGDLYPTAHWKVIP